MRPICLLLLLLSSCVFAQVEPDTKHSNESMNGMTELMAQSGTMQAGADKAKANKGKDVDLVALEFGLDMAKRRMASAERSGTITRAEAETKLADAKRALEDAKFALNKTDTYDIPRKLAEADLNLARQMGRLDDAKAELAQIISMYEGEEFAESSKELVITRSKRSVEQSEIAMALEKQERKYLEDVLLKRELDAAKRGVKTAQDKLMVAEMRYKEDMESLETKVLEAREGVRKAEAALEKGRKEAGMTDADEQTDALQALGYLDSAEGGE